MDASKRTGRKRAAAAPVVVVSRPRVVDDDEDVGDEEYKNETSSDSAQEDDGVEEEKEEEEEEKAQAAMVSKKKRKPRKQQQEQQQRQEDGDHDDDDDGPSLGGKKKKKRGGKKSKKDEKHLSEEVAMSYVKAMRLSLTGARVGDVLVGKHNINHKALVQVVGQPILPCRKDLDGLRRHATTVWPFFLTALQRFPFFAAMTVAERDQWLQVNQSRHGDKDHFIGDDPATALAAPVSPSAAAIGASSSASSSSVPVAASAAASFSGEVDDAAAADDANVASLDRMMRLLVIQPGEPLKPDKPNKKKKTATKEKTTRGLCDLDAATLEAICEAPTLPADLERLCSPNHISSAAHPVLIFIKRLWKLDEGAAPIDAASFVGVAIDVFAGTQHKHSGATCPECVERRRQSEGAAAGAGAAAAAETGKVGSEVWYSTMIGESEVAMVVRQQVTQKTDMSNAAIPNLIRDAGLVVPGVSDVQMQGMVAQCIRANKGLTSAGFKSLLQKLIRFQPHWVQLNKDDVRSLWVPASIALVVCVCMEARNKGSFVPDIQRSVTGLESVTKRLAVTCFEDACQDRAKFQPRDLVCLLAAAKLAQSSYAWFPERPLILKWIRFSLEIQQSSYAWDWNIPRGAKLPRFTLARWTPAAHPLVMCSILLDDLRSFKGDLDMVRDIATNRNKEPLVFRANKDDGRVLDYAQTPEKQQLVMPLCHCVDFHWTTDFAYYMDPAVVESLGSDAKPRPFADLFSEIWKQSSSLNPRRAGRYASKAEAAIVVVASAPQEEEGEGADAMEDIVSPATSAGAAASSASSGSAVAAAAVSGGMTDAIFYRGVQGYTYLSEMVENHPFVKMLRNAQWLLLETKRTAQQIQRAELVDERPYRVEYNLDMEWLSAMLGPIEVKVNLDHDLVGPAAAANGPEAKKASKKSKKSTSAAEPKRKKQKTQPKAKGSAGAAAAAAAAAVGMDDVVQKEEADIGKAAPAAKVGVLETKGVKPVLVSLKTNNPYLMVAMRKPSRGKKNGALHPTVVTQALLLARNKLMYEGVALQAARAPCAILANKTLFLVIDPTGEETYMLFTKQAAIAHRKKVAASASRSVGAKQKLNPKRKRGAAQSEDVDEDEVNEEGGGHKKTKKKAPQQQPDCITWEDARRVMVDLPIHAPLESSPWIALYHTGSGVAKDFERHFEALLRDTPMRHLQRCMTFISGCRPEIHMNRISREGRGLKHAVSVGDVGAFQFLVKLSVLAPAALRPLVGYAASPGAFRVGCGPLMWTLRDRIRAWLNTGGAPAAAVAASSASAAAAASGWAKFSFEDAKGRTVRDYQQKCIDELIESMELGRRARFLWQRVGSGKTFICLLYLKYLARIGKLPKYILFSSPRATFAHLIKEIRVMGLDVHPLIPTLNFKDKVKVFAPDAAMTALSLSKKRKAPSAEAAAAAVASKSKKNNKAASDDDEDDDESSSEEDETDEEGEGVEEPGAAEGEQSPAEDVESDEPGAAEDEDEDETIGVQHLRPFAINVVEHDDLRRCKGQVVELGKDIFFVLDECDKAMNDTKRTSAAIDIAQNAAETLLMTGTAVVDAKMQKLIQWFQVCMNCAVTPKNVLSIANSMVANETQIDVQIERPDLVDANERFQALPGSWERYRALAPVRFGGTNKTPSQESFRQLCDLCWEVCDNWIVNDILKDPFHHSIIVTRSKEHSGRLKTLLLERVEGLTAAEIHILEGKHSTFVTPDTIRDGGRFYRFFLFDFRNDRGYELTAYDRMYMGVYFCGQSTRTQCEGRVVRMSQLHAKVRITTPHCGILSNIFERQEQCKNMTEALSDLKHYFQA